MDDGLHCQIIRVQQGLLELFLRDCCNYGKLALRDCAVICQNIIL